MSITGIYKHNILKYDKLPGKNEVELFEEILKTKELLIERIVSNGWNRDEDKWYDQENEEWVLLLKGNASIEFENNLIIELYEGDYMLIPSHCKHKVVRTSSEPPCIWLAIHLKEVN